MGIALLGQSEEIRGLICTLVFLVGGAALIALTYSHSPVYWIYDWAERKQLEVVRLDEMVLERGRRGGLIRGTYEARIRDRHGAIRVAVVSCRSSFWYLRPELRVSWESDAPADV